MKTRSETVSFRADCDLLKMIDHECERFGISRGSWVRGLVIASCHGGDHEREADDLAPLIEKLHEIESQCNALKSDTARSLYFVLTMIGNIPKDEAKELVRSKFLEKRD